MDSTVFWKLESGGLKVTDRPAFVEVKRPHQKAKKYNFPSDRSVQRLIGMSEYSRVSVEVLDSTVIVSGSIKLQA